MTVFQKLDAIRERVDREKIQPLFSDEVRALQGRHATTIATEKDSLLRVMAKLIAYSNNAPSDRVTELLEGDLFEKAFHGFDLESVAADSQGRIVAAHWGSLRPIRFQKKVGAVIDCAKVLLREGAEKATIAALYDQYRLPVELHSEKDIDLFWEGFDGILARYQRSGIPYFKNMTTLLHLLLHVGFPCLKPDLIVMKVAAQLGLVPKRENHNTYRPHERRLAVRALQEYCLSRSLAPAVLDLYLLVYGGQRYALRLVKAGFVPLNL